MPKDEFDFNDPFELNGVGIASEEDTTEPMTECFIEEFMRLGYNAKQILALFRNPHYIGMNMVVQNRGEQFVRERIAEIFLRWGRPVLLPSSSPQPLIPTLSPSDGERENYRRPDAVSKREQIIEHDATRTDPTGVPIPILNS